MSEKKVETGGRALEKEAFSLRLRGDLYDRLKYYVETYARRHESMNFIITRAIETELERIEAEAKK